MSEFVAGVPVRVAGDNTPVWRILGHNPGPMTGPGTNSYLIGEQRRCLVDPGPADDRQFECFMNALGEGRLDYILVTHTHGDHSPGAQRLQQATGAELVGMAAPQAPGQDQTFNPQHSWQHGELIDCGDYSIELIHTPGHVSNHICYLIKEEQLLFTGDHVLQGTTSVILPPDGDMGAYLDSLRHLQTLPLKSFAPGHGGIMDDPGKELASLIAHRLKREQKIVEGLQSLGNCHLDELVETVYDDVARHLIPWAKRTMLAHLIKLQREGVATSNEEHWQLTTEESD